MGNSSSQEEGSGSRHPAKTRARSSSKTAEHSRKSHDAGQKPSRSSDSSKTHRDQFLPSKPVAVQARPQQTTDDIPKNSIPQDQGPTFSHNEFSQGDKANATVSPTDEVPFPSVSSSMKSPPIGGGAAVEKFKAAVAGVDSSESSSKNSPKRPTTLRRKSTLLLQGEHEPEVDEDMEFHKLNLQPGLQPNAAKPLSRAGSGDEIQIGEEYYTETKYETLISWQQGGEKVYVTGSFTGWRRMIKLTQQEDGLFSVVLKLPAGTHRMRFVVDNELRCSDYMPSATDSMGNLVNYIEVGLDSDHDMSMEPLHRTTSNYAEQQRARDEEQNNHHDQKWLDLQQGKQEAGQSQPPQAADAALSYDDEEERALNGGGYERFHEELPAEPVYKFTNEIPSVFIDPEIMEQFVASDFVTPPQLPPHLESVILNSNSNEKDNNSVLPIPNHVVLNHLATTSIKHNVLAVASISRYSRKYVTQILYAPL